MSSSEASSCSARNLLYKVFIHRGSDKNAPIVKDQLEEWFASLVEPFKINVKREGDYGFAYFGSKRDARACIAAFHRQPPFYYNVYVGTPETSVMNERDIEKMNTKLEYQAKRLKIIEMQMRELKFERSKLKNELGSLTDFDSSDSDCDEITSDMLETMTNTSQNSSRNIRVSRSSLHRDSTTHDEDDDINLRRDRERMRARSRSRISSGNYNDYGPDRRDKSLDRQQYSNYKGGKNNYGQQNRHRTSMPGQNRQYENNTGPSLNSNTNNIGDRLNKNTRHSMSSNNSNNSNQYNNRRASPLFKPQPHHQRNQNLNLSTNQNKNVMDKENRSSESVKRNELPIETVPMDRFVQATINVINIKEKKIWVSLTSCNEKLNKIKSLLYDAPKNHIIPEHETYVSQYCIVQLYCNDNGIWFRAKILVLLDVGVIVQLIDYGQTATYVNAIVEMPDCLYNIPAQGILISCPSVEFTQFTVQQKINIKAISQNNNITICNITSTDEIIEKFKNNSNEFKLRGNLKTDSSSRGNTMDIRRDRSVSKNPQRMSSSSQSTIKEYVPDSRQCIINSATLSHAGTLKLKTIIDSDTCVVQCTIMGGDFLDHVQTIQNIWMKYPTEYINPSIGDFVCVENDEDEGWSRGYVLNKTNTNECHIGLVDEGVYVKNIEKCCKILPEHVNIPDFACLCKVEQILCDPQKFAKLFIADKTYGFVISSVDGDENDTPNVKCILKDRKTKEGLCEMKLSRWIPPIKKTTVVQPVNRDIKKSSSVIDNHQRSQSRQEDQKYATNPLTSTPVIYNEFVPKLTLSSGSCVIIALVETQHTMFAKYRESSQHLLKVTELIASSVPQLQPMNLKLARIGQCVAAQYSEDQLWYRAEIISINSDGVATVLYIDYGNKEEVNVNHTKMLTSTLLEIPRALVELKLRDLSDQAVTLLQAKYLEQCIESKIKFKLMYDTLNKGVYLVNVKNETEILNDKLISLRGRGKETNGVQQKVATIDSDASRRESRTPKEEVTKLPPATPVVPITPANNIRQDKIKETVITPPVSHTEIPVELSFAELPFGKTEIIFQNVIEPEERLIVCYRNDVLNLLHVQETLTHKICEYLETNTDEKSYIPPLGTSCIAKFEGSWYRALCLETDDNSAIVMFVDFGNHEKVNFTNIRKLPKEFAIDPAIALICTVLDVPSDISAQSFIESLNELAMYEVDVIEKEDIGQYKIHIPGISAVNKI